MAVPIIDRNRPHGLSRLLTRAPIALYHSGLGWILGHRFLLLIHTGRRTDKSRETVLEVAGHDTKTGTYFVVSGWGEKSEWLRNIQQKPDVEISVGRHRMPVLADRLAPEQAEAVLLEYARQHRLAARILFRIILGRRTKDTEGHERIRELPVVALKPREGSENRRNSV